jgi:hypothetical protein
MKKTFYEILWSLAAKEGLLDKWKTEGILLENNLTYAWSPIALEKLGLLASIGELSKDDNSELILDSEHQLIPKTEKQKKEPNVDWIDEYIAKFSAKKIGVPGKAGDKKGVVVKMKKFLQEYDYTREEILGAVDLYIDNLHKTASIRFIQECGYFISKTTDGVKKSNLSVWCDEYRRSGGSKRYTSHNII